MRMPADEMTRHLATGLDPAEARRRLEHDGANEIESERPRTVLRIAAELLSEPMFLLLIAAAGIYLVLGDLRESLVLVASIAVIAGITLFQERRTENALARLRDLSSPRAAVIRNGVEQRIPGREVVLGDVVLLREGDRVAADAQLHEAIGLSVDESIITGESLPVDKVALSEATDDAQARVSAGTLIVRGHGVGIVIATGARSDLGRIGHALQTLEPEVTPLFREVRRVVRLIAIGALCLCVLIALAYALREQNWLAGILAGITVAMGVLPEEFPVVLTLFLAMGAWRISRANVLARRLPAVESIGAATVLCVDKTGTLTENRMRVAIVASPEERCDLRVAPTLASDSLRDVLFIAAAASETKAFDPMEKAIHESLQTLSADLASRLREMDLIREYDFTPQLPAVTHVWQTGNASDALVAMKGAPETVLDLCRIGDPLRARLLKEIGAHAQDGLRMLAVASARHASQSLPPDPSGFELHLLGFIGLADPLRAEVPATLATCRDAGIRVAMITGDHPGTARAIAQQAGFRTSEGLLTGAEIARLGEDELRQRVRNVTLFARMSPDQKLRVVQALQANGEVVAMTGDGVNDAPSLKAADIGVAMGARGTDVAREAAAIVLVDDSFTSLVGAVRLGRRIYENIAHAMTYIIAVHVPMAGMGLLPVLLGWPLLLFPMHVLFLEFVIDPACAFVFEADPESPDVMRRPPRGKGARMFDAAMLVRGLILGSVALLVCLLVYGLALQSLPETQARALAFIAMVSANLALIFVARSRTQSFVAIVMRPNRLFWWIVALAGGALMYSLYNSAAASLFQFTPPPPAWAATAAVAAIASVLLSGRIARRGA